MTDFDQKAREILRASYDKNAPGWHIGHVQDALAKALREAYALGLERAGEICQHYGSKGAVCEITWVIEEVQFEAAKIRKGEGK